MPRRYRNPQMIRSAILVSTLGVLTLAAPVEAGRQRDGLVARQAIRDGRILSIRDIERRVVPRMAGADYIGFDFDGFSAVYTLKFLREGSVIWVEVDGRSGEIVGRSDR